VPTAVQYTPNEMVPAALFATDPWARTCILVPISRMAGTVTAGTGDTSPRDAVVYVGPSAYPSGGTGARQYVRAPITAS